MRGYVIERNLKSLEDLPPRLKSDVQEPEVMHNEVLIDVHCAGLNFFDVLQLQGKYQVKPPFPYVPGAEFSGVISACSPIPQGCHFVPGKTRVFGAGQGAYGEKIKLDWSSLIEMPPGLSFELAAGLYITYPTSYAALVHRAKLQKGETILIHAAAGGVGLAAVQIAKALGARVIATASTLEKLEVVKHKGGLTEGDSAILYSSDSGNPSDADKEKKPQLEDWQKKVLEITKGKGVDVVYDPVGMINKSIKVAAWDCRLVVIGFAAGKIEKIPANLLLLKNIAVTGLHWGAYSIHDSTSIPQVWAALLELIRQGALRPAVFETVYNGLEELPKGLAALGRRETWGKSVLRVRPKEKNGGKEAKL